jgi:isopentenyl-diphosphate delta-isomerase
MVESGAAALDLRPAKRYRGVRNIVSLEDQVILVDENDRRIGVAAKMEAHRTGALHRAFSVFVFNSAGDLLLQQRADGKYHSGGLWTNTCCSHPRPDESTAQAARRRLKEEMGIACELDEIFSFIYHADLDDGLSEHEYDHVFVGTCDGDPTPDPREVRDWRWLDADALRQDLDQHPERYTFWFKAVIDQVLAQVERSPGP